MRGPQDERSLASYDVQRLDDVLQTVAGLEKSLPHYATKEFVYKVVATVFVPTVAVVVTVVNAIIRFWPTGG